MKDAWMKFKTTRTAHWLHAAAIRALKTVAQAAIAAIGAGAVFSNVDWRTVTSSALLAGVLSLLTSLAGLPEVKDASPDAAGAADDAEPGEK